MPASPKATVLFIHGFEGNSRDFGPMAIRLAELGYKVVAPDMPGRGKSAWLPAQEYNLRNYVDTLTASCRHEVSGPLIVMGEKWGGLLALSLENVLKTPAKGVVLLDVPKVWHSRVEKDLVQWSELVGKLFEDKDKLIQAAADLFEVSRKMAATALQVLLNRVFECDDFASLAVDPTLFWELERNSDRHYNVATAIEATRAGVWALNSQEIAAYNWEDKVSAGLKKAVSRFNYNSVTRHSSGWYCPNIQNSAEKAVGELLKSPTS